MTLSPDQISTWKRTILQIAVTVVLSGCGAGLTAAYVVGKFQGSFESLVDRVAILERNDDGKGVVLTSHTQDISQIRAQVTNLSGQQIRMETRLKEDIQDLKDYNKEMKSDFNKRLDTIIGFLQRENDARDRVKP